MISIYLLFVFMRWFKTGLETPLKLNCHIMVQQQKLCHIIPTMAPYSSGLTVGKNTIFTFIEMTL